MKLAKKIALRDFLRVKTLRFGRAPCRMKGFVLHSKAVEMIFLCERFEKPLRPSGKAGLYE